MFRFLFESSMLLSSRMMFGDEQTGEWLFNQEYDAGFVGRHTHQLASLYQTTLEAKVDD